MDRREFPAACSQQVGGAMAEPDCMAWHSGKDRMTVTCHEDRIPEFVEHEIAKLYGSLYSSMPVLRAYDALRQPVNTYVLHHNGKLAAIFLVRIDAGVMNVLNEGIPLSEEQLHLLSAHAFSRYPELGVIRFRSVHLRGNMATRLPHQRYRSGENIVISLPRSVSAYHDSLGKNTRRNLKRYRQRLLRDFPGYHYEALEGRDVDEADVRAIIDLNIARMASKNKVSAYTRDEIERQLGLVRHCGLVGIARIDGRICAGALSFRSGDNYALSVLAHDEVYNDYSLGVLCAHQIICDCIERGATEFHFLWGRYDYKFLLKGKERALENLSIYRSSLRILPHAGIFLRNSLDGWQHRIAERLRNIGKQKSAPVRIGLRLLANLRAAKRALTGPAR